LFEDASRGLDVRPAVAVTLPCLFFFPVLLLHLHDGDVILIGSLRVALRLAEGRRSKPAAPDLMKLRGGASVPEIVLGASATAAMASGAGVLLGQTELVNKVIWLGMTKWSNDPILAVSALGWGAGKIVAVSAGEEAIKLHCKMGSVIMTLLAFFFHKDQGFTAAIMPLLFASVYAYIGYFA
jgi:hypothetical protein